MRPTRTTGTRAAADWRLRRAQRVAQKEGKMRIGKNPRAGIWISKCQLGGMTHQRYDQTAGLIGLIPSLRRRAHRLTRSPAEADDLVQETLLHLWQRMEGETRIENLPAYAMRTLSNEARRHWRNRPDEELHDDDALIEPEAEDRLTCAETLAAIARLPRPQRDLMELVVEGETSPRTLAGITHLPVGTVMSRLARARSRLKEDLEW